MLFFGAVNESKEADCSLRVVDFVRANLEGDMLLVGDFRGLLGGLMVAVSVLHFALSDEKDARMLD